MTDAELLEAIRTGDPGAFDAFVERYGNRLFAFGLRMCGHHEDAEDVFQETLLRAFHSLESLRDPGAMRTWLFRVVSNQCLMMRRKDKPERQVPLDDHQVAAEDAAVGDPLPDALAVRGETRRTLERALHKLPKTLRIVLLLRDVEGLSTAETADILGLGASAVKMRLSRGRAQLREILDGGSGAHEADEDADA